MTIVRGGQQHKGGADKNFERQVRRGNGGEKGKKMSEKQRRRLDYEQDKRNGKTKQKPTVQEYGFMSACHCRGKGTCTYCIQERLHAERAKEQQQKQLENLRLEEARRVKMRRDYPWFL